MKPALAIIALLLAACTSQLPDGPVAPPAWSHAPSGTSGLSGAWWREFGDPDLDRLVREAWANNPDIEVALRRVQAARADRFEAMAKYFPTAGLAAGFREGREQDRSTGFRTVDIDPWTAEGGISWEIDLTGRIGARAAAAKSGEAAAYARWQGTRLLVATEVCAARFEESLLAAEIELQHGQLNAERQAADLTQTLLDRGLVSSADHAARIGGLESFQRELSELERLRENARLRLTRLLGGSTPSSRHHTPRIPPIPARVPAAVWQSRPDLIAAEAEVRQSLALYDAARLDLLPSLSLGAGGDFAGSSLRSQYSTWKASVGPRLEIPVWDPARVSEMKRSRAETAAASAAFRSTADKAIEEIEAAYVDRSRYQSQLASLEREVEARRRAWQDSESKRASGVASASAATDLGRAYRDASAAATRMRLRTLDTHLRLIRALGG